MYDYYLVCWKELDSLNLIPNRNSKCDKEGKYLAELSEGEIFSRVLGINNIMNRNDI